MEKEQALRLWDMLYQGSPVAYDYASHPMNREDFRDPDSENGWDVDYKQPLSRGGNTSMYNYIPTSLDTKAKRDGKTTFKINNFLYEVRKGERYGSFHIVDVTDRNNIIDMEPNRNNQDPEFNEERMKRSLENPVEIVPDDVGDLFSYKDADHDILLGHDIKVEESDGVPNQIEIADETAKENEKLVSDSQDDESEKLDLVIQDLLSKLKDRDEEIERLSGEISDLRSRIQETQVQDSRSDEGDQRDDIERLEEKLRSAQEKISALEASLESRDEQIRSVSEQNSMLSQALNAFNDGYISQDDIDEVYKENRTLKDSISEKDSQIDELSEKNAELSSKIDEEDQKRNALKEYIDDLFCTESDKVRSLRDENEDLRAKLSAIKEQSEASDDERAQIRDLENTIESLRSLNETLTSSEESLTEEVNTRDSRIEELEKTSLDLQEENQYLRENNKTLQDQITDLKDRITKSDDSRSSSASENENLRAEIERLQSEKEASSHLSAENEELKRANSLLNHDIVTKESRIDELQKENEGLRADNSSLQDSLRRADEHRDIELSKEEKLNDDLLSYKDEIEKLQEENRNLLEQIDQKDHDHEREISSFENDRADKEKSLSDANDNIEKLQNQLSDLNSRLEDATEKLQSYERENQTLRTDASANEYRDCYLMSGGDINKFAQFRETFDAEKYDRSQLHSLLRSHPEYLAKRDVFFDVDERSLVLDEDLTDHVNQLLRKERAIDLFHEVFNADETSDFAGREIRIDDYQNESSRFGWDFIHLDTEGDPTYFESAQRENIDDILIANLRSLKEFKRDGTFRSDGHTYRVSKIDGRNCVVSDDVLTDPYNYTLALETSKKEIQRPGKLVYILVRLIGGAINIYTQFADMIDKAAIRCAPSSYLNMQFCREGSVDFLFLTFDGDRDEVYRETEKLAILINSYRKYLYEDTKQNAIIILDELDISSSLMKHVSFKVLFNSSGENRGGDIGLKAINYNLLQNVINSTIRKTIHVGEKISAHIENRDKLRPSALTSSDFSKVYNSSYRYDELNLIYSLRREAVSSD